MKPMDEIVLLEAYPFTCPVCGNEQMARPSLFMQTGMMNTGHGSCLNCNTFLQLEIAPENDRMIAEDFDKWLEENDTFASTDHE